ncbi:hypothetical protein KCU68_g188, partial [Aureobasidium melanogenum]
LDRRVGVRGLVGSLTPVRLDLADEAVLVLLSTLLDLLARACDVVLELLGVPSVVGLSNLVVPVVLDQINEVLAVGRGRVGNIVVREPSLQLGLMPLVVSCNCVEKLQQALLILSTTNILHLPALLNQVLAATDCAPRASTAAVAKLNLIFANTEINLGRSFLCIGLIFTAGLTPEWFPTQPNN